MKFWLLLALFWAIVQADQQSEKLSTRPRGVPPELTSFYQEREQFECLDGSKKIPFGQVNDDYCDCADGSDEPGTAACKNGRFYCANLGYRPLTVPSSRVNDFICDCCDGSDEWDSGTECPNICEAQGSKARAEAQKQRVIEEAGWTKRVELAKEGQKLLEERRVELERKKKELEQLEELKQGAEERKKEAEQAETEAKRVQDEALEAAKRQAQEAEARAMMGAMDTDRDGKVSPAELKQFAILFAGKGPRTEGVDKIDAEGSSAEELLKEIFPDGTDSIDGQTMLEKLFKVRDYLTRVKELLEEQEKKPEEEEGKEEEGTEDEEKHDDNVSEPEETERDTGPQYDEPTRALIAKADEARNEFSEYERKVGQLNDEIRDNEQFLEFEYGPDQAWAPLKGKCAELTTTQYTYKICLFDKTVQKDRGGYSEINLGYWGSWSGPESNKFASQKYDHGQSCWNGPERSTQVEFQCGDEIELVEASEPAKCEYKFVVKAPTACRNPEELLKAAEHSEL